LSANGFGESRPKVPDTSAANRAINRRVEFIVQNPQ
jgi:flagellar motor protein MotB